MDHRVPMVLKTSFNENQPVIRCPQEVTNLLGAAAQAINGKLYVLAAVGTSPALCRCLARSRSVSKSRGIRTGGARSGV
jgi:hypothetical protein